MLGHTSGRPYDPLHASSSQGALLTRYTMVHEIAPTPPAPTRAHSSVGQDRRFRGKDRRTADKDSPADLSLREFVQQLPIGLLVVDDQGRPVLESTRLGSLWEAFGRDRATMDLPRDAHRANGGALAPEQWPIARSLHGHTVVDEPIELGSPDGANRAHLVSSAPMRVGLEERVVGAVMLVNDVTDRHENDELREAFVSVLSHELRTPITSIYGGVELLRLHDVSEKDKVSILSDIAIEAESLNRIVEDLLVVVRLERETQLFRGEPVLLQRVIAAAVAHERRLWPEHRFEVELPPDLPAILGDDGLVRQVLRNLLSNAAKYGPRHGRIQICAERDGDTVQVRVVDEGPGIPVGAQERIFELFFRAQASAARAPGIGIGLYVCEAIVRAMGGSIWAADSREGGAEFGFRLPVYPEDAAGDGFLDGAA